MWWRDEDVSERPASALDDQFDREELRARYYGLLQELRVMLPGVQILVAFLLTVPFANRFARTDATERTLFGVALIAAVLSVVAFVGPIAFHRIGPRRSRSARLIWAIRLARLGLLLLAVSLLAAVALVTRFVFGGATATACTVVVAVSIVATWVALPLAAGGSTRGW
jgi:hypothetical protein